MSKYPTKDVSNIGKLTLSAHKNRLAPAVVAEVREATDEASRRVRALNRNQNIDSKGGGGGLAPNTKRPR
jgi:hypothetical protein